MRVGFAVPSPGAIHRDSKDLALVIGKRFAKLCSVIVHENILRSPNAKLQGCGAFSDAEECSNSCRPRNPCKRLLGTPASLTLLALALTPPRCGGPDRATL